RDLGAVLVRNHEVVVGQASAEPEHLLCPPNAIGAQLLNDGLGQVNGSALTALRRLKAEPGPGLLKAFHHREPAASQIHILPPEGADLAAPKSAEGSQQDRDE